MVVSSDCTLPDTVGEPGPATVEQHQAAVGGEALDMADEQRLLPGREQVARHVAHEHDVGSALADNLVGDRDVAAARVPNLWKLHPDSVTYAGPAVKPIRYASAGVSSAPNQARTCAVCSA